MYQNEIVVAGVRVTVISHDAPHPDELIAEMLVEQFADEEFINKYCPDGKLFLGVEGVEFDEHDVSGKPIKEKGEHCVTLVAKALNIIGNPELQRVIKYGVRSDRGNGLPFEIGAISNLRFRLGDDEKQVVAWFKQGMDAVMEDMKKKGGLDLQTITLLLMEQNPNEPSIAFDWFQKGMDAQHRDQQIFFNETRREFKEKAEVFLINWLHGIQLKAVLIKSDSHNIAKFAKSALGCQADIVIHVFNERGNMIIFTSPRRRILLNDMVRILRSEEQEINKDTITDDWNELGSAGTVEGAPEWFLHAKGTTLFNGSFTHPNVPPTKIPVQDIKMYLKYALSSGVFVRARGVDCNQGICTSTLKDQCPWFKWGLTKCKKIRDNMYSNSE